jgi:hypothetical protein
MGVLANMPTHYYHAKVRGGPDHSGVVLPDLGERSAVEQRAAELLSFLTASRLTPADVELLPYFPPEQDRLRLTQSGWLSPIVQNQRP